MPIHAHPDEVVSRLNCVPNDGQFIWAISDDCYSVLWITAVNRHQH